MTFRELMSLERHDLIEGPGQVEITNGSLWRVTGKPHKDETTGEWIVKLTSYSNNSSHDVLSNSNLHAFELTPYLKRKYGFPGDL